MSELDRHRGRDDAYGVGVGKVGRQQHEHWSEPFATGIHQMP